MVLTFNLRKRMSNNFMLSGSMVLQRQKANYDNADSSLVLRSVTAASLDFHSTEIRTTQRFLNDEPYAYAPGGSGKSGVYPYSEWQFKMSGVYQFGWDFSVGAFARYQQGYPFVLWARIEMTGLQAALGTGSSLESG